MNQYRRLAVIMLEKEITHGLSERLWGRGLGGWRNQNNRMQILYGLNLKFMTYTKIKGA